MGAFGGVVALGARRAWFDVGSIHKPRAGKTRRLSYNLDAALVSCIRLRGCPFIPYKDTTLMSPHARHLQGRERNQLRQKVGSLPSCMTIT